MDVIEKYNRDFSLKAISNGYSADEIQKCLNYAKPILEKGLPIIYNTSHLSSLVGYKKKYLKRASGYSPFFYKKHIIPKKNGGFRSLYEPLPSLKEIQMWILTNILDEIPISRYAKAYTYGRSIKDHVKYHKGQKVVITMDIEDFFGSIDIKLVNQLFLTLGYSDLVANLLARLCCYKDSLPQGASTSPRISNIILLPLDNILANYCRLSGLKYSRYADDLAFSGEKIDKDELEGLISKTLRDIGNLSLKKQKTMIMHQNRRQTIAGIIVNQKIQVPKEKRDELRQALYYIEKFGLENHLKQINCSKSNYIKHLIGITNYITFINPKDEKTINIKKKLYNMLLD